MDQLLFHPKLVHIPIALSVLMPLIAGGLLLAWWRDWLPRRTWFVAVGLQAILIGGGMISLQTGEAEEEAVEKYVAERHIEEHEDAAKVFVFASAGVLALMLAAALIRSEKLGKPLALAATVGTLAVLFLGYRTGEAGGRLVYEHGAARAYTKDAPAPEVGGSGAPAPAPEAHGDGD